VFFFSVAWPARPCLSRALLCPASGSDRVIEVDGVIASLCLLIFAFGVEATIPIAVAFSTKRVAQQLPEIFWNQDLAIHK
jgi:hypothetical protein